MKLKEITDVLEGIAPRSLAEDGDNVGLLVGDYETPIKKIMLTVDLTRSVFKEARNKKVNLIVAYHPPIWEPLKKVVAGEGLSPFLHEVIRDNMALYALHTALDSVRGGVNDVLAEIVGIKDAQVLIPPATSTGNMFKLVVFLPEGDLEKVGAAIFAAGAGQIGNYSKCSFRCRGTGTFEGSESTRPTVGRAGRFEQADEFRLEAILPAAKLAAVIRAMITAHSYEEVAYDVFPLMDSPGDAGLGRFGDLPKPAKIDILLETIKKKLKVKTVGVVGPARGRVKRAAVAAGSCGMIFREVIKQGCDFYLTGELKHHHALELQEARVTTMCVGHSVSERVVLPKIAQKLRREAKDVAVSISRKDHDPFVWR
ncbi:MAG: hypothetical protein AMJ79_06140 [Phycisphaerae bacterium SM23_30]|nr:MAG: hypothetical protein AMJ79_06140 [Phycisphaerae bacterium SM23_30]